MYQMLSQSVRFCRLYIQKHFGVFFSFHSVCVLVCIHCLKKVPTFKLSVTLSILTDFQNFFIAGKRIKFATKTIQQCPPHLRHYLGKLKIQIFRSYSADMEESANKLNFKPSNFVIHPQILIFSVFNITSFSPY